VELLAGEIGIASDSKFSDCQPEERLQMHRNRSDEEFSDRSDVDLFEMLCAGDESAFLTLYRRRQGGIYRFALRMSGSEAVAEDVTQEVFMHLMRGNGNFDAARGSFQAYLFGIARNQVLRRIERDRAYLPISHDDDELDGPTITGSVNSKNLIAAHDPLVDLTRQETIDSVRQAVLSLPTHYREAVVLCDLHEMSYLEAAEVLGCAVGTIRSRLHRARGLLVERLRGLSDDGEVRLRNSETVQCFV
jgi:RNA polymerase sigma-70 factor (ECF subfamily)